MLLCPHPALEELLVLALSRKPGVSAEWLLTQVSNKQRSYTIQAVYKELRKLQTDGIVFKQGKLYGLSLSWVLNLWSTAEQMLDLYSRQAGSSLTLPGDGEIHSYVFSRLAHVDDLWIHYLLLMLQNSEKKVLYQWLPHPWFHLIHSHKSWPLHEALKVAGYRVQSIVGGATFLDQYSKRITTNGAYEFYYGPGPFSSQLEYYSVSDHFLFTLRLDKQTTGRIELLYSSVTSSKELDVSKIVTAINQPGRMTVTVESGTKKANNIWRKFQGYFEI